jgi:hypothetical protein
VLYHEYRHQYPLCVQVRAKPAGAKELVADIAAWVTSNYPGGESGIVYVLTRKDAESLAQVGAGEQEMVGRACHGASSGGRGASAVVKAAAHAGQAEIRLVSQARPLTAGLLCEPRACVPASSGWLPACRSCEVLV